MLIAVIEIMALIALLAVLVLVRMGTVTYNLVLTAAQRFIQILIGVKWLETAGKISTHQNCPGVLSKVSGAFFYKDFLMKLPRLFKPGE